MRYSSIALRLLSLLLSLHALGAADFIDPSFRAGVPPITRGTDGPVYAMDQSPDGRIVIAGDFARVNGVRRHAIARLLADGTLDTTFDAGLGPDNDITSVVALADGSVLVGGRFQSWSDELAGDHLVRLKPTGAIDHDFAATPAWDGEVVQIIARADGGLMVLERRLGEGSSQSLLERRLAGGVLDTQFAPAIADGTTLNALARTTNGGLLVVGRFSEFDGYASTNLARLKPDDSVDTTFSAPAAAEAAELFSVASANDGRVAIGGSATNTRPSAFLAVLQSNGQRDPQFTPTTGPSDPVTKLAFDGNGILLEVDQYPGYLTFLSINRFTAHGDLLSYFPFFLSANNAPPLPLADGSVLWAVDSVYNSLGWITRTFADGSVDPDFVRKAPPDDGFTRAIITLAALPGGDIFANGTYSYATNLGRFVRNQTLVRLDPDGAPRVETNAQLSFWGADFESSVLLPGQGQKLYVAGNFYAVNGDAHVPFLARLNGDGSIDPTFRPGFATYISGGGSQNIYDIALLDDGRLYAGGNFNGPSTSPNSGLLLARFQPDGSLDSNFVPLRSPSSRDPSVGISCFVPLDQDRVLFWGSLDSVGATAGPKLYAYTAAGGKSPGPNLIAEAGMPLGSSYVRRMIRLKDGRVLLLGSFSSIAGIPRHNLAILRPDLTVDETFDSGSGPNDDVLPAIQLTDGRLLVGGMFTRWNGKEHRRLVLLRPDGQLDESFDAGTGPDDIPIHLIEQPDGRVLIAGRFTNLDGRGTARLARLVISSSVPPVPAHLILQPQTAISTNLAASVVLKAAALGTAPLRYQWLREGVPLTEGGGFSGTGSPLLTIQGTNMLGTAGYYLEVANDYGRERSATVIAGLASGTMDPAFSTDTAGQPRLGRPPLSSAALNGMVADMGNNGRARRVLLFGNFTNYDQSPAPGLAVINPDGSRHTSWAPPAGVNGKDIVTAAFLSDGRLVLAGKFARNTGAPRDVVLRLRQNGELDDSFDPGDELKVSPPSGLPPITSVGTLALDGEGVFIAGLTPARSLRRLRGDGRNDAGFLANSIGLQGEITALAVELVGEHGLLIGGNVFAARLKQDPTLYHGVVRVLRDGRLDTNYNAHLRRPEQSALANVSTILPGLDGGAFVAGTISEFDSVPGPVIHLDAMGSADTNFFVHLPGFPSVSYFNRQLRGAALLPDGRFLLNYRRLVGSTDTVLGSQPDGTLTVTAGSTAETFHSNSPIISLGDGSYLLPISIRGTAAVGRFFLSALSLIPVANVPPTILLVPQDVMLTNRPGYQEPLVLSAVVQAGGSVQMQWQWNGVLLAGETNTSLRIAEPRLENSGQYRLEVSNAAGSVAAVANVTIVPAAPTAPPLSAERRAGDARIHLHFSPQPGARYHLERGTDFGTWETVTDPAVRVSDSEFAPALEAGSVFFRLVLEP